MARSHGTTTIEKESPKAAPDVHTQSHRLGAKPPSGAHTRRRTVTTIRAWLGTSTWPAYCAAGITAAYGLLKAYWVFGGTALWSIAPLAQEMIDKVRSHTAPTWFVVADAVSVVLAVAGVLFALATVRPRRWLPVWLVRWTLWPLATFMVLRATLGIIGDVQQIALWCVRFAHPHGPVGSRFVVADVPDLGSAVGSDCNDIYPPRAPEPGGQVGRGLIVFDRSRTEPIEADT